MEEKDSWEGNRSRISDGSLYKINLEYQSAKSYNQSCFIEIGIHLCKSDKGQWTSHKSQFFTIIETETNSNWEVRICTIDFNACNP